MKLKDFLNPDEFVHEGRTRSTTFAEGDGATPVIDVFRKRSSGERFEVRVRAKRFRKAGVGLWQPLEELLAAVRSSPRH